MENQDSKSSQQKESNLDGLPENSNDYWKYSEIHTELVWQSKSEAANQVKEELGKHYFIRIPGHQAQCNHCDWGFQLEWGDKIKDGHLYNKKGKLVI